MKIRSFSPSDSASTYYRQEVPFKTAVELGLAEWRDIDIWPSNGDGHAWEEIMETAFLHDVITTYSSFNGALTKWVQIAANARERGEKVTAFFYDCDDNVRDVSPLNPVFKTLGTRGVDGRLLKPGDKLTIPTPGYGEVTLWEDGVEGFDVARNRKSIAKCERIIKAVDGLSVSTPRLAKIWKEALGLKNVYVFPNSIVESDWPKVETVKHSGTVRVLWQGANAHYPDWWEVRDAVAECVKKFPEVVWVIWGDKYPFIHDLIPSDKLEFHNWVPYAAYRYKLATLDFDFALAPLIPNRFNECKSAIKWYEAAMMGKPTLVSRTPPYSDEIIEGETALAYRTQQEFVDGFEQLVRDAKLRDTLASNTRDWLSEHRDANKTVPPYIAWLKETKEKVNSGKPRKRSKKRKRQARMQHVHEPVLGKQ